MYKLHSLNGFFFFNADWLCFQYFFLFIYWCSIKFLSQHILEALTMFYCIFLEQCFELWWEIISTYSGRVLTKISEATICSIFTREYPCRSSISIKLQTNSNKFQWICCIFSEHLFLRTPLNGCFWNLHYSRCTLGRIKPLNFYILLSLSLFSLFPMLFISPIVWK